MLEGIEYLMDCPNSIAPLKILLPTLAPLLHDKSDRVRVSFMKLLQVRGTPSRFCQMYAKLSFAGVVWRREGGSCARPTCFSNYSSRQKTFSLNFSSFLSPSLCVQ